MQTAFIFEPAALLLGADPTCTISNINILMAGRILKLLHQES
jgi:hypothetical protein